MNATPSVRARTLPVVLALVLSAVSSSAEEPRPVLQALGIEDVHLTPAFWVAQLEEPDAVLMERPAIAAQNERLMQLDPSMHDLEALPATLTGRQVATWIEDLAQPPSRTLYGTGGEPVSEATVEAAVANRNLAAIPERQATRYGLVVRRAALRTFPTALRVFRSPDDSDIDRFQESALFPGTPVVIAHESLDGRWWFVVSPRYAAWIQKRHVAEGPAADVFAWRAKKPYRIVTGAAARTVYTPDEPALSELELEMGVRLPVRSDWPSGLAVNGQHPYTAHVIELPLRTDDGHLRLAPALIQKNAETASDYLPLTRANIIRQGFRFLGERYGWGHSYGARDCSGFVSEVY
ncbi:MAG TPA: SH3 domain-containing protein, partial [Woeseiaceae bacterium]|nr:SH3 domain-containing protein [Woeseiaceae bacterium]